MTVNTNSATAVGTLNFNDSTPVIGSLTGNGNVVLNNPAGTTLTIGNANTNTTFSGVISQGAVAGGITKVGSGTLTLNGPNTYTGATTVNEGILQTTVAAGTPFSTGAVVLNSGTFSLRSQHNGEHRGIEYRHPGGRQQVTYGGGAHLALNKGLNISLTLTAGNASASGQVLVRSGKGTLDLPANGTGGANLGVNESFLVNGTAPPTTAGIVNPVDRRPEQRYVRDRRFSDLRERRRVRAGQLRRHEF